LGVCSAVHRRWVLCSVCICAVLQVWAVFVCVTTVVQFLPPCRVSGVCVLCKALSHMLCCPYMHMSFTLVIHAMLFCTHSSALFKHAVLSQHAFALIIIHACSAAIARSCVGGLPHVPWGPRLGLPCFLGFVCSQPAPGGGESRSQLRASILSCWLRQWKDGMTLAYSCIAVLCAAQQ
jgi:hypothetical protein